MRELKIGEVTRLTEIETGKEIWVRCVKDVDDEGLCKGCYFVHKECGYPELPPCSSIFRSDGKSVHFELVKHTQDITEITMNVVNDVVADELNKVAERAKKEMIRKARQWCCDKCHAECYYDDKNDCMTIQSITKAMEN